MSTRIKLPPEYPPSSSASAPSGGLSVYIVSDFCSTSFCVFFSPPSALSSSPSTSSSKPSSNSYIIDASYTAFFGVYITYTTTSINALASADSSPCHGFGELPMVKRH
ncbi:hypothetical protein E2C01_071045 [Portunus trituberculatus]|uniref:Uncharacterized protein n=1 Tax=Portunus trituberculatus TaxID=210409 RepID=A0A5B7I6Z2_PORTR|nr:hypothetical protein [Portunus trituberculatus]